MCLALPARLIERLADEQGWVELAGVRKRVLLALVPDAVVGDYLIVHVGHAIGIIDKAEALRTLAAFAELDALDATSGLNDHGDRSDRGDNSDRDTLAKPEDR